jgi:hypothetical protein
MWTQVVGKIRLALTPLVNHWWNVPLYVTARGLTTSPMVHGGAGYEIVFDLLAERLEVLRSDGARREIRLEPKSVARFHREVMDALAALGADVRIRPVPVEVPDPVPFAEDERHAAFDADAARRCWRVLLSTAGVLERFRGRFLGKASPVHFFWGSFDLAMSLFSGRRAPPRPGADGITREAYSHEVMSFGFWPGGSGVDDAAFYGYAAPAPPGFAAAAVEPEGAAWHAGLGEFVLPYEAVRGAADPDRALLAFCTSVYEAGAELGRWDRAALERAPPPLAAAPDPHPLA